MDATIRFERAAHRVQLQIARPPNARPIVISSSIANACPAAVVIVPPQLGLARPRRSRFCRTQCQRCLQAAGISPCAGTRASVALICGDCRDAGAGPTTSSGHAMGVVQQQ